MAKVPARESSNSCWSRYRTTRLDLTSSRNRPITVTIDPFGQPEGYARIRTASYPTVQTASPDGFSLHRKAVRRRFWGSSDKHFDRGRLLCDLHFPGHRRAHRACAYHAQAAYGHSVKSTPVYRPSCPSKPDAGRTPGSWRATTLLRIN